MRNAIDGCGDIENGQLTRMLRWVEPHETLRSIGSALNRLSVELGVRRPAGLSKRGATARAGKRGDGEHPRMITRRSSRFRGERRHCRPRQPR